MFALKVVFLKLKPTSEPLTWNAPDGAFNALFFQEVSEISSAPNPTHSSPLSYKKPRKFSVSIFSLLKLRISPSWRSANTRK